MKTNLDKRNIEAARDAIQAELKSWTLKLEEAKKQVEYWRQQADAIGVIGMRLLINSWAEGDKK